MAGKGRHPLFEDVPDDELEGDGPAPFLQKAQSKGKGSSIFQSNRGSMFKGSSQRYVQDTEASYQVPSSHPHTAPALRRSAHSRCSWSPL